MNSVGILLLAIVAGYWLLERAAGHRGSLKKVGQILGAIVIVLALAGTACKVLTVATSKAGWSCKQGGWFCPYAKQDPAAAAKAGKMKR